MASQLRYDAQGRPYYSDRDWGEGFSLDTPAGQLVKPVPKPRQARSSVPRPFPRQWTPEDPATQEEIDRAFYSPVPGAPPPRPVTGGGMTPAERAEFFANAGVDPSALGMPAPQSIETIKAVQDFMRTSPERQMREAQLARGGRTVRIDGQVYSANGRPAYGDARRYQGTLGDEQVGMGVQTGGLGTSGGMGSSLMRGRLPAPVAPAARRAPAGGYLDFNEWLAAREAKPEDTGTAQPRFPDKTLGMSGTPMGGMVSASMIPSMAMGATPALPHGLGVPAAYAGRGIPKPPVTPVAPVPGRQPVNPNLMGGVKGTFVRDATGQLVPAMKNAAGQWVPTGSAPPPAATQPVAPSAAGSWTDPVQPRFPPGRGGGPVYNPATATAGQAAAGTVAPAAAQAAAQAAGGPAPSPGFFRRNWPVGAGVGAGGLGVALLSGGGQVQQVQMEDGTVVTIPVGETYEDKVARRRGLVAERGIQKGEARALRMGKAGPELRSRAYMAQSPEATAAIMAARERAMGEASANVPVAQAMMQQAQLQGLSAVLADPNATPEAKAQAQEQIANMPPIVAPYGGGIDPQQRYMGIPDYRGAAPVRPVTPTATAPSAPGSRPVVGEIDPNAGDIRKQQEEILRQEKAQAEFDAQAARVQSGDAKGVIDNDPEIDSLVSSGVRPEYVVQRMIAKYPGMSRDAAMKEVQRRAGKWSGYMDMVVPMY